MTTIFADKVYSYVKTIPQGKVSTYKSVAVNIGYPNASRGVGNVLRRNPYIGVVPCHRVVRTDGVVGGLFGDKTSNTKIQLLIEEGVDIVNGKVKSGYMF